MKLFVFYAFADVVDVDVDDVADDTYIADVNVNAVVVVLAGRDVNMNDDGGEENEFEKQMGRGRCR